MNAKAASWGRLGLFLLLLSLLAGFGFRSFVVNRTHSLLAGCNWCFIAPAWTHDLLVLALALGLTGLLLLTRRRLLRIPAAFLLLLLVTFFWLDVIVHDVLNYRVRIEDVMLFSHETRAIVTFIQALRFSVEGLFPVVAGTLTILGGLLFAAFAPHAPVLGRRMLIAALIAGGLHFAAFRADPDYVFNDAILNFIEINYPSGVDKSYAAALPPAGGDQTASAAQYCATGSGRQPRNVILLVVESLSAYHSSLIVSNHGYTPFLDKLARENSYFTNFFANGFTTDGGLISLLTGRVPVPSVGRYRSVDAFEGFSCVEESYPKFMKRQGYTPVFFSNGSLEFTNLGGWAQSIGFDYVEGPTHPYYAQWEKGLFDAVEDHALFLRFANWLDSNDNMAGRPYAAVLMTHSTHPPFVDPATKTNTEARVYRYMDQSVESFVTGLTRRGYFSSGGLLMITGDHRGYTPISREEHDLFGESARARIPFIVVGDAGLPRGENRQYAQQADLLNSMKALAGTQAFCMPPNRGLFLGAQRQEPQFVFHASGKDRDQIKVFYPDAGIATIKLNGNETAWTGKSPANRQAILDALALDRMTRGKATVNYVDYLYKVTFDNQFGSGKFAQGAHCTKNTPAPGY